MVGEIPSFAPVLRVVVVRRNQEVALVMTRAESIAPRCAFFRAEAPIAAHGAEVDAIEQHRKRCRVELDRRRRLRNMRHAKASALRSFVINNESTRAEKQNFYAVAPPPEEDEKRSAVGIGVPKRAYEGHEPVVPASEIDRLCREHDLDARAEVQHVRAEADTIAARCSAVTSPLKASAKGAYVDDDLQRAVA